MGEPITLSSVSQEQLCHPSRIGWVVTLSCRNHRGQTVYVARIDRPGLEGFEGRHASFEEAIELAYTKFCRAVQPTPRVAPRTRDEGGIS